MRKLFNFVLGSALLLSSCANEKPAYVFPQSLADGWNLQSQQPFPSSSAPESIRPLAMNKAWMGTFTKETSQAKITVYEAVADAVAFEASQKWRHLEGQMAFNHGPYFVIVESSDSDLTALEAIVKSMELSLKSRSK